MSNLDPKGKTTQIFIATNSRRIYYLQSTKKGQRTPSPPIKMGKKPSQKKAKKKVSD